MIRISMGFAVGMLLMYAPVYAQNTGAMPQKTYIACRMITPAEVSQLSAAGPVEVSEKESGEDADTQSTSCTWRIKGSQSPPAVILTIENGDIPGPAERMTGKPPAGGRIQANFSMRKIETFDGPAPEAVPGLGDEAFYRDFEHVKGGALLVRRGVWIVTFSGSISKGGYIALARLVLQRL